MQRRLCNDVPQVVMGLLQMIREIWGEHQVPRGVIDERLCHVIEHRGTDIAAFAPNYRNHAQGHGPFELL